MTPFDSSVAIREQNGACGIYAGLDHWIGSLYFVSYCNLFLTTTLSAYEAAADTLYNNLGDGVVTPKVVTRAIIGAIANINGLALRPGTIGFRNMTGWITRRGAG